MPYSEFYPAGASVFARGVNGKNPNHSFCGIQHEGDQFGPIPSILEVDAIKLGRLPGQPAPFG